MPAQARGRRPYAARLPAAERKQQLLDAALRIIAERGHNKATMDNVAEQAGVTKPVVYTVFSGRAELLGTLLAREQAAAISQVLDALNTAQVDVEQAAPAELIADVTRAYLNGVAAAPHRWRCILFAVEGAPDELRSAIDEARELLRRRLAALLTTMTLQHPTSPPVDVDLLAHALITIGEKMGQLLLDSPDRYDVDRLVRFAKTMLTLLP